MIFFFLFGSFTLKASLSTDATEAAGSSFLLRILICVLPVSSEHKTKDVYRQFVFHYFQWSLYRRTGRFHMPREIKIHRLGITWPCDEGAQSCLEKDPSGADGAGDQWKHVAKDGEGGA